MLEQSHKQVRATGITPGSLGKTPWMPARTGGSCHRRILLLILTLIATADAMTAERTFYDWRRATWPGLAALDPALSGPQADADDDGLPNLFEFAFGRHAERADSEGALTLGRTREGGSEFLTVGLWFDKAAADVRVGGEVASRLDNLVTWTAAGVDWRTNAETSTQRQIEGRIAMDTPQKFVRLRAELTDPPPVAPVYTWREAETYSSSSGAGPESNAALSGGQWIWVGNVTAGQTRFVQYSSFSVPQTGPCQFYVRKFWKHGPFRWRFDSQPWQSVGSDVALLDEAAVGVNVVNWVHAGEATLTAGSHTLRIELLETSGAAAFDAFLLTKTPFVARGKLKPEQKYNVSVPGWSGFEPDLDPFRYSPIDLRVLNEAYAGEHGFIQARGEEFVHGQSGQPVRFWAVNIGPDMVRLDKASFDHFARSLAKRGVNLVRLHGAFYETEGANFGQVDAAQMERLLYAIAALKREGIYSALSIYFPLWVRLSGAAGYPGYDSLANKNPFALLYFNPKFQATYRGWWDRLLTTTNSQTGLMLRDDPAVAALEMVNEDSYLFWTFNPYASPSNLPNEELAALETAFGAWLTNKYGSLSSARTAWGGTTHPRDNFTAGRVAFRDLWTLFNSKTRRDQDTATFLTWHQKKFYEETYAYLKETLKFKGCVTASNWTTADARTLGPLDKYANTVGDFMDRHGYFEPQHTGPGASYSIAAGQQYDDRCALFFSAQQAGGPPSFSLPIMDVIYDGRPSTISEINWPMPNRFRADVPLLSAAYGLLQGTDGFFFFAAGAPAWSQVHTKFPVQTPVLFGQFPAADLIFRLGLVRPAEPVVDVPLKLADLYALKGAPVSQPQNFDALRAQDIPPGGTITNAGSTDPLAFLVGKVGLRFSETGGPAQILELSQHIDRTNRMARSITGELKWDWGRGLVTINTPRTQGALGFLQAAGAVELADVRIQGSFEYGAVVCVALDQKPLAESRRILVQVMSEDRNNGWQTSAETGLRTIQSVGGPPIVVRNFSGTVTFKRGDAAGLKHTALDLIGYETGSSASGGDLSLGPATLYYLVER